MELNDGDESPYRFLFIFYCYVRIWFILKEGIGIFMCYIMTVTKQLVDIDENMMIVKMIIKE